jgi:predicted MFS family arabinose efflux permease
MDALKGQRAGPAAAVMTAGLDVGKIVGPLLGGLVAAAFGLEMMFVIIPLGFLAAAIVVSIAARQQRRDSGASHG